MAGTDSDDVEAIKQYAPVILHNQSKSLLVTESLVDNDLNDHMSNTPHIISWDLTT